MSTAARRRLLLYAVLGGIYCGRLLWSSRKNAAVVSLVKVPALPAAYR